MKRVRIGNGCGFWGDQLDAPVELVKTGRLDYLTLEYLAELTMSILSLQRQRDPQKGFATDFISVLKRLAPYLIDQPNLKIVTNAGGVNPEACMQVASEQLRAQKVRDVPIAVVQGDNLFPHLDRLLEEGHRLAHMDNGTDLATIRDRVVSANAYLGARPIVEALKTGARIVITGRVADASLTVAPAAYEFDWDFDNITQLNRFAGATIAGHLIECGAQSTGGLACNWQSVPDLANVGYPIADIDEQGEFILTKPEDSGGLVNRQTVTEQLLYEVFNPAEYFTPDLVADFTSLQLEEVGPNRVLVQNASARPATSTYKVSIAYRAGHSCAGMLLISGPQAKQKAEYCAQLIWKRLERIGLRFDKQYVECIGTGAKAPGVFSASNSNFSQNLNSEFEGELPEVMLRIAVSDSRQDAVERFSKEFAPLVTSGPPGVSGYTSGRPPVREVFAYWPALIDKSVVDPLITVKSLALSPNS